MAKTVMGWMRRQAEAGSSKAGTGSCTDCGILTSMARCRAMKHHLSEGFAVSG